MRILILLAMILVLPSCTLKASNSSTSSSATSSSTKRVLLNWTAGSGTVSGYYVEQSTAGGSFAVVQTVNSTTTSATIAGLNAGTSYQFRVRAFNTGGTSPYTSAVSVSP